MKIRLTGTRPEIDMAVPILTDAFDVVEVSAFYPNRGDSKLGRVYVETTGVRTRTVHAAATRADRGGAARPAVGPAWPGEIEKGGRQ